MEPEEFKRACARAEKIIRASIDPNRIVSFRLSDHEFAFYMTVAGALKGQERDLVAFMDAVDHMRERDAVRYIVGDLIEQLTY